MTSEVHTTPSASKNNNRRVAIISAALVAGLLGSGGLVLRGTEAVFSANTDNAGNSWQAGTVTISDNDSGSAMFTMPAMAPGDTLTRCIAVEYDGNVEAPVKLYVSASAGNLRPDLDVVIDEAPGTSDPDCTGFDTDNDVQLDTDTLADLAADHGTYGTGLSSWEPSAPNSIMSYRFQVTLGTDTATGQQGESATATFRWEAQAGS